MRALGGLNGSCLTSIAFDRIDRGGENYLDKTIEFFCKGSPSLKKFSIIDPGIGRVTDAAVESIVKYCPHIEAMPLCDWDRLTDLSLTYLSKLSYLRELDLSHCQYLTSAGVQGLLESNRNLEVLILKNAYSGDAATPKLIDDALLRCIGINCPSLVSLCLCLGNSNITTASLDATIKGLPMLNAILLDDYNKPNTILPMLGMYCKGLKDVDVRNIACSNDDFISMCQGCPLIETLHLRDIKCLTDISILALSASCPMLKVLSIYHNNYITDDSMCILLQQLVLFTTCIHLTSVTLEGLKYITDKTILTLLRYHPKLKQLGLHKNPRLTDYCILAIPTHCLYIQSLSLWSMTNLIHETIVTLSRYCKQLQILFLYDCEVLTNDSVLNILKNCKKQLTYINIHSKSIDTTSKGFKRHCNQIIKKRYKQLHLIYSENGIDCSII